jgi:hypothetical protein
MKKILTLLLAAQMSFGDCPKALQACEEVIKAQDQAIDNLKKNAIVLKKELENEKRNTPAWVLVVGGIALGVILNSTIRR